MLNLETTTICNLTSPVKYLFIIVATAVVTAMGCFLWFNHSGKEITDDDVVAAQKLLALNLTDK